MSLESDEELISRIAGKDEVAFAEFVGRYQKKILNLCFRLTANQEWAEEAAQEVFLSIYREAHQFKGLSKVSTWVYRIAVNCSLNICKKMKRQTQLRDFKSFFECGNPNSLEIYASTRYSPEKILEYKQETEFLKKALSSLPENQKVSFLLT